MKAEVEVDIGDFSFSYSKESVAECLIHTEKGIRNIIHFLLTEKLG